MLLRLAACLGVTGVALGAFGAHAVRARLAPERLDVWRTAVQYHLVHALAVLAVAALAGRLPRPRLVAGLFAAGVVIFSGSLYALCLLDGPQLGAVTPLGGLTLLFGWAVLGFSGLKETPGESDGPR